MRYILFLLTPIFIFGQASPINPTPPVIPDIISRPSTSGYTIINVHSGEDLQAIYNAASCKTDIIIDDGIIYTTSFNFSKQCTANNWILVEGSGCNTGASPITTYLTAASANSNLNPPISSPSTAHYFTVNAASGVQPIETTNSSYVPAKYNYFGCIQVTTTNYEFWMIGTTYDGLETLASQLGDHIIFDRIWVHGLPSNNSIGTTHAFYLNGSNIVAINTYCSDIYINESQCLYMADGPGPYYFSNNFLSASTEIILAGGGAFGPGYHCDISASPAPTNTAVTTMNCIDASSSSVPSPPIGTRIMVYFSTTDPKYNPGDSVIVTGNTAGALTFNATTDLPLAGVGHVAWGISPADITATNNVLWKNPQWNPSDPSYDGIPRLVKNCFEMKTGQRVNYSGNVCINTWPAGQQQVFNLTSDDQNGDCPWCFSSDINVTNNIFKNISSTFLLIGTQGGNPSRPNIGCPPFIARIKMQNNLFFAAGADPYIAQVNPLTNFGIGNGGCSFPSTGGPDSVQVIHNTFLGEGYNGATGGSRFTNVLYKDNITQFDTIPWFQVNNGCTYPCFAQLMANNSYTFSNNAIINSGPTNMTGLTDGQITAAFGSTVINSYYDTSMASNYSGAPFLNYSMVNTDYHNWRLTGSGPWRNAASDSIDPGVNFTALDVGLFGGTPLGLGMSSSMRITGPVLIH